MLRWSRVGAPTHMVPTKTVRKKNTLLVIIGTVGVASLFFFYSRQDESFWLKPVVVAKELVRMAQPGYAIYTSGCKIPAFDPSRLIFGNPLSSDFVFVTCSSYGAKFHEDSPRTLRARSFNRTKERLNVVIVGLDSVSRLNSLRHLKRTREFLLEQMEAIELYGYNKESPKYGLFNYLLKGFKDIPTDYYCRPMIFAIDNSKFKKFIGGGKGCVGSNVQTSMYLDYTTSLVSFLGNRSYFTYTWISDVTHDNFNSAGFADEPFLRAFQRLNASGVMTSPSWCSSATTACDTDPSGRRSSASTRTGCPSFVRKYPHVVKNLKTNQRRLTTHYDLHATLLELADFPNDLPSFKTEHGTSLGQFPVTDPLSKKMANFVLETVNGWLHQGAPGKCVRLQLRSVVDVYEVTVDANSDTRYFWVTLKCFRVRDFSKPP
ncbi:hypothetical protein HPB52_012810 [Rhipicephalus sanguineus]|uniref:Uncharacterized protein n=1 Tax=Rhipicephalus sanguineus TaxID=34632 RepID=A0A9D4SWU7_RHISA|nr:hypothetical protein HPB52_012810 [Rhipicephalus sanguineus]